jgi:hypothetical protein
LLESGHQDRPSLGERPNLSSPGIRCRSGNDPQRAEIPHRRWRNGIHNDKECKQTSIGANLKSIPTSCLGKMLLYLSPLIPHNER